MARKRGGLAGVWDRNKGVIKNTVPVALSMIPGIGTPLAIGARAAMEGFDREGQGGIGFDLSDGIQGAIAGAGQASMGNMLKGGVQSLFNASRAPVGPVDLSRYTGALTPDAAASAAAPAFSVAPVTTSAGLTANAPMFPKAAPPAAAPVAARTAGAARPITTPTTTQSLLTAKPAPVPAPSMTNMTPSLDTINATFPGPRRTPVNLNEAPGQWWKSKEGMGFAGQAMNAGANLIGSQRAAALEEERMAREQREAQARAELMALFAPRIMASYDRLAKLPGY